MTPHVLQAGTIWAGDWMQAPLEPGYTLAIIDGPYGMGKADWDRMGVEGLADWYDPHLARVSALLAPSASVYLWNTAEGWARIDPVMRAAGWTFRRLIVWDKGNAAGLLFAENAGTFGEAAEYCGAYTRGAPFFTTSGAPSNLWRLAHGSWTNERVKSGVMGVAIGGTTEWAEPLHPCQKPLLFAERMIRASTRPNERILVPFGGTCREAVVCEWLARTDPAEARSYDCCELNLDPGRDYIAAALAQIRGEDLRRRPGQEPLFAVARSP